MFNVAVVTPTLSLVMLSIFVRHYKLEKLPMLKDPLDLLQPVPDDGYPVLARPCRHSDLRHGFVVVLSLLKQFAEVVWIMEGHAAVAFLKGVYTAVEAGAEGWVIVDKVPERRIRNGA